MNNEYKVNHKVKYSEIDNNYNMRLDHIFNHFQDITGLHSVEMEIDGQTMLEQSNAFWVLTKMKVKIHRIPKFQENIIIETWPIFAKGVKFGRDYIIKNEREVLVSCCSEWCMLDFDTKRIRRVESVHYPHSMIHRQDKSDAGEFLRIKEKLDYYDFNHCHKIQFCDIDTNNHTNNIAYARMVLNSFTLEELSELSIKEIQLFYLNQSFIFDEINIFKKKTEYGYYIEGHCKENVVFSSIISTNTKLSI